MPVISNTNFGCIIAYLAFVCVQNDSEESIRHNVQKTIETCRIFNIPKHKPCKRPILITLTHTDCFIYQSIITACFILFKHRRGEDALL